MKEMARITKERSINRKMTSARKGSRQSLDRIEVPTFDWYYSIEKAELYHYDER